MAINWNQAEYVAPKLQISPDQLPLEAGIKVGDVLQSRYDKAIETDTKIGALTKKLMGSVDLSDQALAKEITETYGARFKERRDKGDYQNMQWQTMADADDFASIYTGLTGRAKEISDYKKSILDRKDVNEVTKRRWLDKFNAELPSASFDKENRFVSNLNVDKKSIAGDVDPIALVNAFGTGWHANSYSGQDAEYKISDGVTKLPGYSTVLPKGVAVKRTAGSSWEKVDEKELKYALGQALKGHVGFNDMINREADLDLYSAPLREGETPESRREAIFNQYANPALSFGIDKFGYQKNGNIGDSNIDAGLTSINMGAGKTPTSSNAAFTGIYNKVSADKSIEELDEELQEISKNYDENGKFTGRPKSYSERTEGKGFWNAIEQLTIDGDQKDFINPVPDYYRNSKKGKYKSDKDLLNMFYADLKNNAKVASTDYNVSSKELRETVDANVLANLSGMKLYPEDAKLMSGNAVELNKESRKNIMSAKDVTTKFNLYNGELKISGNGKSAITPLSVIAESTANPNLAQQQLASAQKVLHNVLDLKQNVSSADEIVPTQSGPLRFRVVQAGSFGKKEGQIIVYSGTGNDTKHVATFLSNSKGLSDYSNFMLSEIIMGGNYGLK